MSKKKANRMTTYEFTGEQFLSLAHVASDLIKQRRQFTVAPLYPAGWTLATPRVVTLPPEKAAT